MEIKNIELNSVGNFLVNLSLPAKVSRARTKLVKSIEERLTEYNEERQNIFKNYQGVIDEKTGRIIFPGDKEEKAMSELTDLANETAIIQITYKEQISTLKAYFNDWDEEISGENANAYDVFFDALELEGEKND